MKITIKVIKRLIMMLALLLSSAGFAQLLPTITSFTPTQATHGTVVTITGSGFGLLTSVSFGGKAAQSITVVSATQIQAVVAPNSASGNVVVANAALLTASKSGFIFIPPTATPPASAITRVITDWNGYWNSAGTSAVATSQPDTQHNMLAFGYGGAIYSTGVDNDVLTNNGISFTAGDYRALPVANISGNTSASSGSNNLIMAIKMDGNATAANYQAAAIANLTAKDVLIDGIKGLGLGSGVTNVSTNAVLTFTVHNIQESKIADAEPDIVITQIADATTNVDMYCFTDANGNIVGKVLQANLSTVPAVGTYRQDLFTLPVNTPYSTAKPSANGVTGTKDIRLIAFKLSDFGIDAGNMANALRFRVTPGGDSDIAFIAYNASAITIPAPVITAQPTSVVACPGAGNSATFTVTATGPDISYQWKKNGSNIAGATSASYTISNVQAADAAAYSVVVSNESGSVASNTVYLNTVITLQPVNASTCINTATSLSFTASGTNLTYQWYSNTTNSTSGGTLITNATGTTYTPPVNVAGTKYYYAVITSSGQACAGATTSAAAVTVTPQAVAGTVSANQTICKGSTATLSLTGYTGSIQWQQSANGTSGWAAISGATSANYTIAALNATNYYRAVVTSGTCGTATSATITVTVNNPATAGTISGGQSICGGNTVTLTATGASGSLQWQQSTNGNTWVNVTDGSGATTASYTTAPLADTTCYRLAASGGVCGVVTSNPVTVTVIENQWTGAVSTDWHNDGNWTCGIPTLMQHVVIPQNTNQPVVTAGLTALGRTLNLQDAATVTVNTMNNMHIVGNITVANTAHITINSGANLLQGGTSNTNTGKITVKRDSNPLYRQDYTLWSTPVAGQGIFQFSPQTLADRFYTYDTTQDMFAVVSNLSAQSTTTFATGAGYLVRMPNSSTTPGYNGGTATLVHNGSFTGVPNNGTISVPVSAAFNRYNAIGNPYPSAINLWDFIDANAAMLEVGTLYFWRKKNNHNNTSYATITKFAYSANRAEGGDTGSGMFADGHQGSWTINTGQGFLVKTKAGSTNVIFNNSMRRLSNNAQFFRNGEPSFSSSKFRLNLTSASGGFAQAVIGYSSETTNAFDYGWDGVLLNDGNLSVYTSAEGTNLAIQAKGEFTVTDIVPVAYRVDEAGSYTLQLSQPDGLFAASQDIYLKDNTTGTTHDIKAGDYTFASDAGTFTNRFEVMYINPTMGTDDNTFTTNNVLVYKKDGTLNINTGTAEIKDVRLFDVRGRLVHEVKDVKASALTISNIAVQQQVLVVQVTTADGAVVSKKTVY